MSEGKRRVREGEGSGGGDEREREMGSTWDATARVFGDEAAMMQGSVEAAKMLVMAHEALAGAVKAPLKTATSWTHTAMTENGIAAAVAAAAAAAAKKEEEEEEEMKAGDERKAGSTTVSNALFVSNGSAHVAGEEDDDIIMYKSKSDKDNMDIVCPVLVPAAVKKEHDDDDDGDTITNDSTEKGVAGVYAAIAAHCSKHGGKYKAVDVEECLSGYTKLLNLYIGMVRTRIHIIPRTYTRKEKERVVTCFCITRHVTVHLPPRPGKKKVDGWMRRVLSPCVRARVHVCVRV